VGGDAIGMTEYVTANEAAQMLGVSKRHVYHLIKGRERVNKHGTRFEPPAFTNVIKIHKQRYTWYLIHVNDIKRIRNEKQ
jgi:predicted DNA-binding transcriptional regulator AlpA